MERLKKKLTKLKNDIQLLFGKKKYVAVTRRDYYEDKNNRVSPNNY